MDTFLADTIKALPQILLTFIFSGVGVLLLKSWFDSRNQINQIRFAKSHEATIETLDILYKKFSEFRNNLRGKFRTLQGVISHAYFPISENVSGEMKLTDDFEQYFINNKNYINKDMENVIDKLIIVQAEIIFLYEEICKLVNMTTLPDSEVSNLNSWIEIYNKEATAKIRRLEPNKKSLSLVIDDVVDELEVQSMKLEKLYKSQAGIKD